MATLDPITNLAAAWSPSGVITLSWDAPTNTGAGLDAYVCSVLKKDTATNPNPVLRGFYWHTFSVVLRKPYKKGTTGDYGLGDPPTTTSFTNTDDTSTFAFKVAVRDLDGNMSDYVQINSFRPDTDTSVALPRHLANNFNFDSSGTAVVNYQDTYAEIADSVAMYLGTTRGDRVSVPDYGIPDPTFQQLNPHEIQMGLARWEPRPSVVIEVSYNDYNVATINAVITDTNPEAL
jgi:hypothetical protein